ncbi:MAG: CBS domain-containing protein [Flavobacteriales bacterium]|nr:CBS domain-containing protein [Flavobacteriales bacterium]
MVSLVEISRDIPSLRLEDLISEALMLCKKQQINHVVIEEEGKFKGLISSDVLSTYSKNQKIKECRDAMQGFYIHEYSSLLDSVRIFKSFETNVIPIIDNESKYLGVIYLIDIVDRLAEYTFFTEQGVILELEIPLKKYSVNEISQITESNNERLYGVFLSGVKNNTARIILKVQGNNMEGLAESFERFDYNVVNKYYNDSKEDLLKNRFGNLMKYLEI